MLKKILYVKQSFATDTSIMAIYLEQRSLIMFKAMAISRSNMAMNELYVHTAFSEI
jgi:hypothetical protein